MNHPRLILCLLSLGAVACSSRHALTPSTMPRLAAIDDRFLSFNVEMVEVTGGRFWKPYGKEVDAILNAPKVPGPVGMDPALYQYRPPIDLSNPRLRKLAAALGPAYVRVSGTWANSTYFQNNDQPAPPAPPKGFGGVLTRTQWRGVLDFSHAVDARIVTSFATSAGTRDASGVWTPVQARPFLDYTKSAGGSIAAAEFMNEPTFAAMGGAPPGYDAAAYARDLAVFRPFLKEAAPEITVLGPGSVGEGVALAPPTPALHFLKTDDLLQASGPAFDAFSYHFYGAVSKRCSNGTSDGQTTAAAALSADWLSRTDTVEAFYSALRDKYAPGKPMWITETADAACGGNPWGSTFLDSFRYLHQLGDMAKKGVRVVAHNTLASSDYGLIDENTFIPRPNYWSAVLWRKLMGSTVLDAGASPAPDLYLYAHCLRGQPGGVALLILNTSKSATQSLDLPTSAERYTLIAPNLEDQTVFVNGAALKVNSEGDLPPIPGASLKSGLIEFAPVSITFLAVSAANNPSCK